MRLVAAIIYLAITLVALYFVGTAYGNNMSAIAGSIMMQQQMMLNQQQQNMQQRERMIEQEQPRGGLVEVPPEPRRRPETNQQPARAWTPEIATHSPQYTWKETGEKKPMTDNDPAILIACLQVFLFGFGAGFGTVITWEIIGWWRGRGQHG